MRILIYSLCIKHISNMALSYGRLGGHMKSLRNYSISLVLVLGSLSASAIKPILETTTSDELAVTEVQKNCSYDACVSPFTIQKYQPSKVARKLFYQFQKIAEEQVNVWGDTILEGDYVADGEVHISKVALIYKESELVAYRITYAQNAWDISTCNYDGNHHEETLIGCSAGEIIESSYVSASMNYFEVDENQFAEFKN